PPKTLTGLANRSPVQVRRELDLASRCGHTRLIDDRRKPDISMRPGLTDRRPNSRSGPGRALIRLRYSFPAVSPPEMSEKRTSPLRDLTVLARTPPTLPLIRSAMKLPAASMSPTSTPQAAS